MVNEDLLIYFKDNLNKFSFEDLEKEALKNYSKEEVSEVKNILNVPIKKNNFLNYYLIFSFLFLIIYSLIYFNSWKLKKMPFLEIFIFIFLISLVVNHKLISKNLFSYFSINISNSFWFTQFFVYLNIFFFGDRFFLNIEYLLNKIYLFQGVIGFLLLFLFIIFIFSIFSNILFKYLHLDNYKIIFKKSKFFFFSFFLFLFSILMVISLFFNYFNSSSEIFNLIMFKDNLDSGSNYIYWDNDFNKSKLVKDLYLEKNKLKSDQRKLYDNEIEKLEFFDYKTYFTFVSFSDYFFFEDLLEKHSYIYRIQSAEKYLFFYWNLTKDFEILEINILLSKVSQENEILLGEIINESKLLDNSNISRGYGNKFLDHNIVLEDNYNLNNIEYSQIDERLYQALLYRGYLQSFRFSIINETKFHEEEKLLLGINS